MPDATVGVQGLDEFLASLRQLGNELPHELSKGLRTVAAVVANDARSIAEANGLHDSGDLLHQITTSVRGTTAWIVDKASRVSPAYPGGYVYPARYEYENHGARSFMHP